MDFFHVREQMPVVHGPAPEHKEPRGLGALWNAQISCLDALEWRKFAHYWTCSEHAMHEYVDILYATCR